MNLPETESRRDRLDLAAMAILAAGVFALFWKVIFAGQVFFYRDVFNQSYPLAYFIHEVCRAGYIPYWNPLLNYGQPLVSNPNSLFFYPDTLLIVLLPLAFAYSLHYVLHFALGAVGVYCLARRWSQSRLAAFFAASVFALSGPVLSLGSFYNEAACAAWIPWALLMTDKAVTGRSLRPWILLAAIFSLQFLAGEPFTLMGTFALSLAYAFFRAGNRRQPLSKENLRTLGWFAATGLMMLALAAVEFLPSLHLLANSRRGIQRISYFNATAWSLHPLSLVETVLPGFFGEASGARTTWSFVLSGRRDPYFPSIFIGFVPLLFALVACALGKQPRRKFVAAFAVVFLFLAFGLYTPVFRLAYLLFPALSLVRFPLKLLLIVTLLVSLLAGCGFDALRDSEIDGSRARKVILMPLGILLGVTIAAFLLSFLAPGAIRWPARWILIRTNGLFARNHASRQLSTGDVQASLRYLLMAMKIYLPGLTGYLLGAIVWVHLMAKGSVKARQALPVIAALALVHLIVVNGAVNPTVPQAFYNTRPPVLSRVAPSAQPYRLSYLEPREEEWRGAANVGEFLNFRSIPFIDRLPASAQTAFHDRLDLNRGAMLTGADVIRNSDVDSSMPMDLVDFWTFEQAKALGATEADCLLGRTNVKYEITPQAQRSSVLREIGTVFNGSAQPDFLYQNHCAMPRAFAASAAITAPDADRAFTMLSNPSFDAAHNVILAANHGTRASIPSRIAPPASGQVRILARHPDSIVLGADMPASGYVVLLEHYDRGWKANEDGHNVPILRANVLFQAVRVGPGKHTLHFRYRPPGFRLGLVISLVALVVLAVLWGLNPEAPW